MPIKKIITGMAIAGLAFNVAASALNVKDFGAVGDGKNDDSAAIVKAIGAAFAPGSVNQAIFFPPGNYRICSSISLTPEHSGLSIGGTRSMTGKSWRSSRVVLLWDGKENEPMFDLRAAKSLQIENIILDGNKKAGALIRINSIDPKNVDKSWLKKYGQQASTGHDFNNITLTNANTGILINDDAYICSDCSNFTNINFTHLEYGIDARSEQNLCYLILRPNVGYVNTAFRFNGGGFVEAINVNTHHVDTVFDIANCGINSGVFTISGLRPEQGAKTKGKRPVSIKASGEVNITLSGLQTTANAIYGVEGDKQTPAFILGPSANVLVLGSHITGAVAELTGKRGDVPTFITFQNCRFRCFSDPMKSITINGNAGFRLLDCQISRDGEVDGKYKIFERAFVTEHLQSPVK